MTFKSPTQLLWTKPAYPGDAVRMQMLRRRDEIGDVRIQDYGDSKLCVAAFLPGSPVQLPGDTPKTEPNWSRWRYTKDSADTSFDVYLAAARADGWEVYKP